MNETYRSPESKKELFSLFNREDCQGAFVWVMEGVRRKTYPIEGMELNLQSETLYLRLSDQFEFNGQPFIYIYHPFRKTISKAKYLAHHDNHISLHVPDSVKTLDTRIMPRFKFRPKDEKYVVIRFESPIMTHATQELKCQLIDISQSGLAICVTHKNREFLKNSAVIELTHLGKIKLPKPILINNVYMKPFSFKLKGKRVTANRAGFELEGSLKKFVLAGFTDGGGA